MDNRPVAAIMYDFDKTLSPRNMQEYGFIPGIGLSAEEFWARCKQRALAHQMDEILAYMLVMTEQARGKMLLTRRTLTDLGRKVELFPGVEDWFQRVNDISDKLGLKAEHYIISSGLKEIIQGTSIARHFQEIYAAYFCYDEAEVPIWPALAVNFTSKTQFLFRINKGAPDVTDNTLINDKIDDDARRVPFRNMIYIGDGMTDVPCLTLTKVRGGHSIAVFREGDRALADKFILDERVDYAVRADYSAGSELEHTVERILLKIAAEDALVRLRGQDLALAMRSRQEQQRAAWAAEHGCAVCDD